MTAVELLHIEETGPDFVRLRNGVQDVRITFADDGMFSKEESAGFFHALKGKPAAIPMDDLGTYMIADIMHPRIVNCDGLILNDLGKSLGVVIMKMRADDRP